MFLAQPAQLDPMQLAMTPAAASPTVSEVNASGKKRRFCGACQNHNVKTPVTFQHQQSCQWRNCPCNLCTKKRNISQAQAHKRHAAKVSGQVRALRCLLLGRLASWLADSWLLHVIRMPAALPESAPGSWQVAGGR